MARFVVMLRGVNVGGNILKMDRLRELCDELGFKNTQTYVQSGNLVFETDHSQPALCSLIEKRLAGETRLPISVILRTPAELVKIISGNPFLKEKGIDLSKLHVTFLAKPVGKDGVGKLAAINAGADRFRVIGKEIYLHCPNGYGETKLSNNALQKVLGVNATTRNWNTVNKLNVMAK
jgi:uncharacterized protein (DUF1697 family)